MDFNQTNLRELAGILGYSDPFRQLTNVAGIMPSALDQFFSPQRNLENSFGRSMIEAQKSIAGSLADITASISRRSWETLIPELQSHLRLELDIRRFSAFLPDNSELQKLLGSVIQPHWFGQVDTVRAFEGIAELSSLGKILGGNTFETPSAITVAEFVGDWRPFLESPNLRELKLREQFYLDRGFDGRLVELPLPAIGAALVETGVRPVPVSYDGELNQLEMLKDADDLLRLVEQKLRELIETVMCTLDGPCWYESRLSSHTQRRWKNTKDRSVKNHFKECRLIDYSNLSDCFDVILDERNWNAFRSYFFDEMELRVSKKRLVSVRNELRHVRPVGPMDYMMVQVEAHRILRAIGALNPRN